MPEGRQRHRHGDEGAAARGRGRRQISTLRKTTMSTTVASQAALSSSRQLNASLYLALGPRRLSIAPSGQSSVTLDDGTLTFLAGAATSLLFFSNYRDNASRRCRISLVRRLVRRLRPFLFFFLRLIRNGISFAREQHRWLQWHKVCVCLDPLENDFPREALPGE